MKKRASAKIPEFHSLDEEKEYWEARGPLADGRKGRLNRARSDQKRSSFLTVRLTGEELTQLRDVAAKQGLGPSTFARTVLTSVVNRGGEMPKRVVTLTEFREALERNLPQSIIDRAKAFTKDISIGDPCDPTLILIDGSQMKRYEDLIWLFFSAMFELYGVRVVTPNDAKYDELKAIANIKEKVK